MAATADGERHEGHRVVACQRILQAQSDPFLGWVQGPVTAALPRAEFFVRQFRDMKGSIDTRTLTAGQFEAYVGLCGSVLARAHSQSLDAAVANGYLGRSERFDAAVVDWAVAYADQVEQDFAALERAVGSGRLPAGARRLSSPTRPRTAGCPRQWSTAGVSDCGWSSSRWETWCLRGRKTSAITKVRTSATVATQ